MNIRPNVAGEMVKFNKNFNLSGYELKKKIEEYFNNKTDSRPNSLPPTQAESAFQPYSKNVEVNRKAQNDSNSMERPINTT